MPLTRSAAGCVYEDRVWYVPVHNWKWDYDAYSVMPVVLQRLYEGLRSKVV